MLGIRSNWHKCKGYFNTPPFMKVSRDYSHKFRRGLYFEGSYTRTSFKDESNENWYPTYKAQTWKLTPHARETTKTQNCLSRSTCTQSLWQWSPCSQGLSAMMTETARKTPLKNKHLRNCDYFTIIPSCSHFTMLTMNPATGLVWALS